MTATSSSNPKKNIGQKALAGFKNTGRFIVRHPRALVTGILLLGAGYVFREPLKQAVQSGKRWIYEKKLERDVHNQGNGKVAPKDSYEFVSIEYKGKKLSIKAIDEHSRTVDFEADTMATTFDHSRDDSNHHKYDYRLDWKELDLVRADTVWSDSAKKKFTMDTVWQRHENRIVLDEKKDLWTKSDGSFDGNVKYEIVINKDKISEEAYQNLESIFGSRGPKGQWHKVIYLDKQPEPK